MRRILVISIWHGSGDTTVSPTNAAAIVGQWRALHGVGVSPCRTEAVDGYPRRVWCDVEGREVIEEYSITGMGHGTPLATSGEDRCGRSGAYMLEASISSTHHICRFWGLIQDRAQTEELPHVESDPARRELVAAFASPRADDGPASGSRPQRSAFAVPSGATGMGKVIEDALRAAGLVR